MFFQILLIDVNYQSFFEFEPNTHVKLTSFQWLTQFQCIFNEILLCLQGNQIDITTNEFISLKEKLLYATID